MAKKILVVLDPGHYPRYNKGAVSGYYEGDKMYTLTNYEKKALKEYGIDVVVTRSRTDDMDLYARGQVAVKNGKNYDHVIFMSNHSNACNGKAYGVVVIRSLYLPGSEKLGDKLAEAIVDVMKPTTGVTNNRGVSTRKGSNGADYYGVIRGSVSGATSKTQADKGPVDFSFIVEHGFHDYKKECAFLNVNANLEKIAKAKAKVIADYFGLTKKETSKPKETTKPKEDSYKVKVTANALNVRKGAGTKYNAVDVVKKGEVFTIVKESNGWGKLKSGVGWINLKYVKRV